MQTNKCNMLIVHKDRLYATGNPYDPNMVYISDTRVKNVNSISKYTIVKRLSLDDAWRKGPAMIVNSSFICVKC